ncbi:MAG: SdiA-regulated domain-containing protein, partial [Vicinamibacteria bacterium]
MNSHNSNSDPKNQSSGEGASSPVAEIVPAYPLVTADRVVTADRADPEAAPLLDPESPRIEEGKDKFKTEKKEKKQRQKEKAEFRRIDPWQRYKAMIDALKESQDLVDLADHKARFALIIMGALNAAIIILSTRSEFLTTLPPLMRNWFYVYLVAYSIIAIYFLVQAIESLRPRSVPNLALKGSVSDRDESLGLRFFVDALRYEPAMYLKAWQSLRVSQLNAELAHQLHTLATINRAKYNAVAKLYLGLQAITLLTAGLLMAMAVGAWIEHHPPVPDAAAAPTEGQAQADEPIKIKGGKPKKGGWSILGEPERFILPSVKEPSGIVFSPARGTLFVVGDEGSLVEIRTDGSLVAQIPTGGNLEDVALHAPSGRIVLLSEKKGDLLVFDPTTGKRTGKFKLDDTALLGEAAAGKNQGFEGLAFRPEPGRPGGGVFYLVHQREPAMLIAIAFDPLASSGDIGASALLSRT